MTSGKRAGGQLVALESHLLDWVQAAVLVTDLDGVVIYANQGLRATVSSLRHTFGHIRDEGRSAQLESRIATVPDIFALQQLSTWQEFED